MLGYKLLSINRFIITNDNTYSREYIVLIITIIYQGRNYHLNFTGNTLTFIQVIWSNHMISTW